MAEKRKNIKRLKKEYGSSIITGLEKDLNLFIEKELKDDDCKPEFIISSSLYYGDNVTYYLTVTHNGYSKTKTFNLDSKVYLVFYELYNSTI